MGWWFLEKPCTVCLLHSNSETRRVAIEESRAAIEESRAERVEVEVEGVVDEENVEIVGVVGVELEGAVGEKSNLKCRQWYARREGYREVRRER